MREKITQKEVDLWIGHTPDEWIGDCMYRLFNGEVSLEVLRTEAKLMYKDYVEMNQGVRYERT
jgi:hypothetical protein